LTSAFLLQTYLPPFAGRSLISVSNISSLVGNGSGGGCFFFLRGVYRFYNDENTRGDDQERYHHINEIAIINGNDGSLFCNAGRVYYYL
jgi:hypothetical protein